MELGEEHFWNTIMLVVPIRGQNGEGMKSLNFRSDQNAVNVNYIREVVLAYSFFQLHYVQFSFGMVDCSKMGVAAQGDIIHLGLFYQHSFWLWLYFIKLED